MYLWTKLIYTHISPIITHCAYASHLHRPKQQADHRYLSTEKENWICVRTIHLHAKANDTNTYSSHTSKLNRRVTVANFSTADKPVWYTISTSHTHTHTQQICISFNLPSKYSRSVQYTKCRSPHVYHKYTQTTRSHRTSTIIESFWLQLRDKQHHCQATNI